MKGLLDPTHTGSLGNMFTYKGLRLNVFFTYAFGNVVRLDPKFRARYNDLVSMTNAFKNRWMASGEEKETNVPGILSKSQYMANTNVAWVITLITTAMYVSQRATSFV